MKRKVIDLTGPALDWATLIANGGSYWTRENANWPRDYEGARTEWILERDGVLRQHQYSENSRCGHFVPYDNFTPSGDWEQGGPIIERERILFQEVVTRDGNGQSVRLYRASVQPVFTFQNYTSRMAPPVEADGDTHLIAAMRCFVISKVGDEIELPAGMPT